MSAAHTPGPWWPTESGVRDRGGYIAHTNSVQHYQGQDERYAREVSQREADKRLIAAAPELLSVLRRYIKHDEATGMTMTGLYADARAAIAKATGAQP